ncbi:MAG: hypothetical protein JSV84_09455, partial [Gemmatimonadota bacterium]
MMKQALLGAALMILVCILPLVTQAQDVLLNLPLTDTVRVADYDDGIFVAGTEDGKLYVLDEAGNYAVTDLGAGRVNDIRIERPYIAVAAGSTVVELRLGSLTPQELWRKTFNIWNDYAEEISSLDLSEDGNYVAYFACASNTYNSGELGEVGVLAGGVGGGTIIDNEFTDGSAAINYWLDATGDMSRIATSQPFTDGVDYFGYEAGTALYHFDGSNLEFQWWTLQEVHYEVTEVRVSENKDYVAAATSSGTFMWLLRMSNGDSLASYESQCKEQFACDGDDNLNYVIGSNKSCECGFGCSPCPCPPYDWFILNNDGGAGYSVALSGTMTDPIDDLDATSDGSYFAFGSKGGDYVVLGRHSSITQELSGNVGAEIDAVELGHCGTLLLGGDQFLKLLRFAAGHNVVYVNIDWAGEPCGADLGTGIHGEPIVRCCNGFDNIPDAHAAVAVGGTIITYDGTYYPPGLVVTKDGITIQAGSRPVIDGGGDVGFHIRADNVTVIGYEFTNCLWALVIGPDPLGGPITGFAAHYCYFNDNINDWAMEVEWHPGLIDAELNYWDSCTGPTHPDNPGGRGEIIQVNDFSASVDYVPWLHPCAATWGDTCLDHNLVGDAEDFLMGSGVPDQDLYAVGFYNPGGEARLTSVSFQWYDPGEVDLYVYLGPEGTCPVCLSEDGGPMLADFALDTIASGSFIGNWEWETVGLEDGPCIQIPAKSCFYVVWKMREGMDRPRILADAGHD